MLFSYKYLKNYIDSKLSLSELILELNVIGVESRLIDKDKEIFEAEVSANRNDCLNYFGLAREVSALSGAKVKAPKVKIKEENNSTEDFAKVSIQDEKSCLRYMARVINNVKVSESPAWLKDLLELHGMRPVNNIVDVTNFVLLEYGQPLHAFDLSKITGHKINIRKAKKGESITAINQLKYDLDESMLVIADEAKPQAIAGIMGGLDSEVNPNTASILLESAFFEPKSVRKTSKKLKLKTDSSYHFERQVDWNTVEIALERAAGLIQKMSRGEIAGSKIDLKTIEFSQRVVDLRLERVNSILGTELKAKEVALILKKLGLVSKNQKGILKVSIPSYRFGDLEREIDLIEEVSRIYGYNNIPETVPNRIFNVSADNDEWVLEKKIKDFLSSRGMFEVVPYTFCNKNNLAKLSFDGSDDRCRILEISNPLSSDQNIMKTTVVPGLLEIALRNTNQKNLDIQIFELGKIFIPKGVNELPDEKKILSGLITGFNQEKTWAEPNHVVDFYDLKGILEDLFAVLDIKDYRFVSSGDCLYHPNKTAKIYINPVREPRPITETSADGLKDSSEAFSNGVNEKEIGIIGELHPDIKEKYEFLNPVYLFEINWQELLNSIPRSKKYMSLPKFPNVTRDIAMMVAKEIEAEKILSLIKENGSSLIESLNIFDLYTGKQIPEGQKSIAISISYRHLERTLTDTEIESIQQKTKLALAEKFQAKIR